MAGTAVASSAELGTTVVEAEASGAAVVGGQNNVLLDQRPSSRLETSKLVMAPSAMADRQELPLHKQTRRCEPHRPGRNHHRLPSQNAPKLRNLRLVEQLVKINGRPSKKPWAR